MKVRLRGKRFKSPGYLLHGSSRQRALHGLILRSGVFELLKEFSPVLAGTFPLGIDIEGSDLDVLCHAPEPGRLAACLERHFSGYEDYALSRMEIGGTETVIGRFRVEGMVFEVFGQPVPVREQNGWRHMLAEDALLREKGDDFRRRIVARKQAGMKTEPAFAAELGLEGDPYQAMLDLEKTMEYEK